MNLAVVGVSPSDIAQEAPHEGNYEAVLPDREKVEALNEAVKSGQIELEDLKNTSTKFQNELQQLAQQMKQLEAKSTSLYHELDVRNKALSGIEPMVQARVIPPAIVSELCFGEIGPQWRAALVVAVQHCARHKSELSEKLLLKVSTRIKDYYVSKVRRLRRPGIDAQSVQNDLIHNSELYNYLFKNHEDIAVTIKQAYIATIKWYYQMLLEKYLRWIGRQGTVPFDRSNTIGENVFAAKSVFSFSASKEAKPNLFNVGARPTILAKDTKPMAWGTPAPATGFHAEVLVHSMISALLDTIKMEDRVLKDAFNATDEQVLDEIFTRSLEHSAQILDKLFASWDIFELLLSLKVIEPTSGPPIYEEWKQAQIEKIWISLQRILEENSRSIESAVARPAATRKIGPEPHELTTAVASMLTGVLQLSSSATDPVVASMRQLLGVYEAVATKLSKCSSSPELFLYNNYFLLSSLLSDLDGDLAKEFSSHFRLLTEAYTPK